ncbi:MAG: hypothetical protein JXA73_01850, partial [Acidobacteria bacterium]|nr:hypothetical protein [Acidobacteriota bacterium]
PTLGSVSQPLRGCPGRLLSSQSQMYKLQVAAEAATALYACRDRRLIMPDARPKACTCMT